MNYNPSSWTEVYSRSDDFDQDDEENNSPDACIVLTPHPGETNYAVSPYGVGQLAGAYCLCGTPAGQAQGQVFQFTSVRSLPRVLFWADDLADKRRPPDSLAIVRRIHAAAAQHSLPHYGCDGRKHYGRIYCNNRREIEQWLTATANGMTVWCPKKRETFPIDCRLALKKTEEEIVVPPGYVRHIPATRPRGRSHVKIYMPPASTRATEQFREPAKELSCCQKVFRTLGGLILVAVLFWIMSQVLELPF